MKEKVKELLAELILEALEEKPLTSTELCENIPDFSRRPIIMVALAMGRHGTLKSKPLGKSKRHGCAERMWDIPNRVIPEPVAVVGAIADSDIKIPPLRRVVGVSGDDLKWQEYYRLPREQRRTLTKPSSDDPTYPRMGYDIDPDNPVPCRPAHVAWGGPV